MRALIALVFLFLSCQICSAEGQCSNLQFKGAFTPDRTQVSCGDGTYVAAIQNGFLPRQADEAKCCKTETLLSDCVKKLLMESK